MRGLISPFPIPCRVNQNLATKLIMFIATRKLPFLLRQRPAVLKKLISLFHTTVQGHSNLSLFHTTVQGHSNLIGTDYVVKSPFPDIPALQQEDDIYHMITRNFSKFGSKVGLIEGLSGREYSYNEIEESSSKFSSGLQRLGFTKGDVLGIVAPNCPEYAIIYLGVLATGGVVSASNPIFSSDELAYQFKNSGTKIVVTVPSNLSKVQEAAAKTNVEKIVVIETSPPPQTTTSSGKTVSYHSLITDSGSLFNPVQTGLDDVVILPYSSGTTGLPKGVMLTNRSVGSNLLQLTGPELFTLHDPGTCLIGILPFFHIYGMVIVLFSSLLAGSKTVTLPQFVPETFLSSIEKYRVNIVHVVPPLVIFFGKHPIVGNYDLSSVGDIMTAAAPLGGDVVKAASDRTGCQLIRQGYGLTEASPITHMMPKSIGMKCPDSIGHCVRSLKAKIVDVESGEVLPSNKEGELWLNGPNLMKGYLNNPEATRECLTGDGWLKTGDMGE